MTTSKVIWIIVGFSTLAVRAQSLAEVLGRKDAAARTVRSFSAKIAVQFKSGDSEGDRLTGNAVGKQEGEEYRGRVDFNENGTKTFVIVRGTALYMSEADEMRKIEDVQYRLFSVLAPWATSERLRAWYTPTLIKRPSFAPATSSCVGLVPRYPEERAKLESAVLCLDRRTAMPAAMSFKQRSDEVLITLSSVRANSPIAAAQLTFPKSSNR
jgi:hypothetical protein